MVLSSNAEKIYVENFGQFAKEVFELKKNGFSLYSYEGYQQLANRIAAGEPVEFYFEYFNGVRKAVIPPIGITEEEFNYLFDLQSRITGKWDSLPEDIKSMVLSENPRYNPYYIPENRTEIRSAILSYYNMFKNGWYEWSSSTNEANFRKNGEPYDRRLSVPRNSAGSTVREYINRGLLPGNDKHLWTLLDIATKLANNNMDWLRNNKLAMLEIRDYIECPEGEVLFTNSDGTGSCLSGDCPEGYVLRDGICQLVGGYASDEEDEYQNPIEPDIIIDDGSNETESGFSIKDIFNKKSLIIAGVAGVGFLGYVLYKKRK